MEENKENTITETIEQEQNHAPSMEQSYEQEETQTEAPKDDFFNGVPEFNSIDEEIEHLRKTPKEGDTEDFTKDFVNDKDFNQSEEDFTSDFEQKGATKKNAKKNASMFARWFDTAFSFLLSFWAKDEDFTKFKAEPKSLKVIEESLENGLGTMDRDIEVPWYLGLIIEVPVAYFPKIKMAFRLRKMNTQKKKAQKPHMAQPTTATQREFYSSDEVEDVDVEVVQEIKPKKKGKTLKQCPECGKQHKNKLYCSNACRITALNK